MDFLYSATAGFIASTVHKMTGFGAAYCVREPKELFDEIFGNRSHGRNSDAPFSLTLSHGRIRIGDRNGSVYELQEDRLNKIADSPATNAGQSVAIVDCPIDDGLIVRQSGIFKKTGATLVPWQTDIDSLLKGSATFYAKWIQGEYLAVLVQNSGVFLLNQEGHLVANFTVNTRFGGCRLRNDWRRSGWRTLDSHRHGDHPDSMRRGVH
jgi:hypothetical protein